MRKIASWQVEENITEEVLDKKINELVASRGRKNTDPREVLRKLEVLSKSARPLGKRRESPLLSTAEPASHIYTYLKRSKTSFLTISFLYHYLPGPRKEIPVLMHLISAMFDSQRVIDDYMDLQQWRTCYRSLYRVTSLLRDSKGLVLGENTYKNRYQLIRDYSTTP